MYCTLQGWSISGTGSQQQQWQDHEQPPILELSPEPTRRILELSENYTHKVQCVAGGFGCELLLINRTVHCTGSVLGSLSGASSQGSSAWSLVDEAHPAILHHLLFVHI